MKENRYWKLISDLQVLHVAGHHFLFPPAELTMRKNKKGNVYPEGAKFGFLLRLQLRAWPKVKDNLCLKFCAAENSSVTQMMAAIPTPPLLSSICKLNGRWKFQSKSKNTWLRWAVDMLRRSSTIPDTRHGNVCVGSVTLGFQPVEVSLSQRVSHSATQLTTLLLFFGTWQSTLLLSSRGLGMLDRRAAAELRMDHLYCGGYIGCRPIYPEIA